MNRLTDERLYYIQDANWNVTAVTDESGNVIERYRYLCLCQLAV